MDKVKGRSISCGRRGCGRRRFSCGSGGRRFSRGCGWRRLGRGRRGRRFSRRSHNFIATEHQLANLLSCSGGHKVTRSNEYQHHGKKINCPPAAQEQPCKNNQRHHKHNGAKEGGRDHRGRSLFSPVAISSDNVLRGCSSPAGAGPPRLVGLGQLLTIS